MGCENGLKNREKIPFGSKIHGLFGDICYPFQTNNIQVIMRVGLISIICCLFFSAFSQAPVITGQIPDRIVIAEEQSTAILLTHFSVDDSGSNYSDDFSLTVLSGWDVAYFLFGFVSIGFYEN